MLLAYGSCSVHSYVCLRSIPCAAARPAKPTRPTGQPAPPSAALKEPPVLNGASAALTVEDRATSLDFADEDWFAQSPAYSPGFSSYDEAEETRTRLPVQSLDLVPLIFSRAGTPIMLRASLWLDRLMTRSPGGKIRAASRRSLHRYAKCTALQGSLQYIFAKHQSCTSCCAK